MSLDNYDLFEIAGTGGYGQVWRARHRHLHIERAVKIRRTDEWTPEFVRDFERECRALSAIDHPNVLRVIDAWVDRECGQAVIVTEFLRGGNIATYTPLPPSSAAKVVADAARGLEAIHRAGIVHRDVKPTNLFVASDGTVKVGDLGIASGGPVGESPDATQSHVVACTLPYAAAELFEGRSASTSSDVYALGITLYELLAGCQPFQEVGTPAQLRDAILNDPIPVLDLPEASDLSLLARWCMDRDPGARPQLDQVEREAARFLASGKTRGQTIGRVINRAAMVVACSPTAADGTPTSVLSPTSRTATSADRGRSSLPTAVHDAPTTRVLPHRCEPHPRLRPAGPNGSHRSGPSQSGTTQQPPSGPVSTWISESVARCGLRRAAGSRARRTTDQPDGRTRPTNARTKRRNDSVVIATVLIVAAVVLLLVTFAVTNWPAIATLEWWTDGTAL